MISLRIGAASTDGTVLGCARGSSGLARRTVRNCESETDPSSFVAETFATYRPVGDPLPLRGTPVPDERLLAGHVALARDGAHDDALRRLDRDLDARGPRLCPPNRGVRTARREHEPRRLRAEEPERRVDGETTSRGRRQALIVGRADGQRPAALGRRQRRRGRGRRYAFRWRLGRWRHRRERDLVGSRLARARLLEGDRAVRSGEASRSPSMGERPCTRAPASRPPRRRSARRRPRAAAARRRRSTGA